MINLSPKRIFPVPISAENITPDLFVGKSIDTIKSLPIWEGNRQKVIGDLFNIECKDIHSNNTSIRIEGDVSKVKKIGTKMSLGQIIVEGNVGMRLGEEMTGGEIKVSGNAGSWVGMMMKGGKIEIAGDAGDYIGAPYRGSMIGMKGGTIIVHGKAGNEVGCFMSGGLIKIGGNVGQFTGMHMQDGTILVEGNVAEGRIGAQMVKGKIIVLGKVSSILPSFIVDSIRASVRVDKERIQGPFYLFKGDVTESWSGSLYIAVENNPHLKMYQLKIV